MQGLKIAAGFFVAAILGLMWHQFRLTMQESLKEQAKENMRQLQERNSASFPRQPTTVEMYKTPPWQPNPPPVSFRPSGR